MMKPLSFKKAFSFRGKNKADSAIHSSGSSSSNSVMSRILIGEEDKVDATSWGAEFDGVEIQVLGLHCLPTILAADDDETISSQRQATDQPSSHLKEEELETNDIATDVTATSNATKNPKRSKRHGSIWHASITSNNGTSSSQKRTMRSRGSLFRRAYDVEFDSDEGFSTDGNDDSSYAEI